MKAYLEPEEIARMEKATTNLRVAVWMVRRGYLTAEWHGGIIMTKGDDR